MSDPMGHLEIVELDVHDDAALESWHHAYAVAEQHGREDVATVWQLPEITVTMREPSIRHRVAGWSGLVEGEVVVTGWLRAPLLDNLDRADVAVHVLPDHRRHGHATAMLAHLEQVARSWGRSVLGGETGYAYDAGPDGAGQPGPEFARARGYALALGDVQRALPLPVADGLLDRLAAEAAAHHASYTLRSWVGPVPDDLLQGWADLTSLLMTEAPTGDLDLEPEAASTEAVRESEAAVAHQGRTKINTVALTAAGDLVAYTDIAVTVHESDRAYQWGTLVRADHRGHRLGVAVKVANLRLLQAEHPDLATVITFNAEVNAAMIGVNEQLGFRPVGRLAEFQKRV